MPHPSEDNDPQNQLRISDPTELVENREDRWLRRIGLVFAFTLAIAAAIPLVVVSDWAGEKTSHYIAGLTCISIVDIAMLGLLSAWRFYARGRMGNLLLVIESFQSSAARSLAITVSLHVMALFLLWIPFFLEIKVGDAEAPPNHYSVFVLFAGLIVLIGSPWLVQILLGIRGHDVEVFDEGVLLGGFFPCRWKQISAYSVWDDESVLITFDMRGRAPVNVFMATVDRDLLRPVLEKYVGPPRHEGRSVLPPNRGQDDQRQRLSVFR